MENIRSTNANINVGNPSTNNSGNNVTKIYNENGNFDVEEVNLSSDTGQNSNPDGIQSQYDIYLSIPDNKSFSLDNIKRIDVDSLSQENDRTMWFGKDFTTNYNGGTLTFDSVKIVNGETCYYDENNNLIKKIYKDGSVSFYNVMAKVNMGTMARSSEVYVAKDGTITYINGSSKYIELNDGKYIINHSQNDSHYNVYNVTTNTVDTYDSNGNLTQTKYKDGSIVTYTYNKYNILTAVTKDNHLLASYDSSGKITYKALDEENGVVFDNNGKVNGTSVTKDGVNTITTENGKQIWNSNNKSLTVYDKNGNLTDKYFKTSDGKDISIHYENGKMADIGGTYHDRVFGDSFTGHVTTNDLGETITTDMNGNVLQKQDTSGITLYNSDGSVVLEVYNDGTYTEY